jgi:hypothetical protein
MFPPGLRAEKSRRVCAEAGSCSRARLDVRIPDNRLNRAIRRGILGGVLSPVDDDAAAVAAPRVEVAPDDDPGFIACVERVTAASVVRFRSELACLVRVRGWFAHRWLPPADDHLAFPPFTRDRVAEERHWARRSDGAYVPTPTVTPVHNSRPHRNANDRRRRALAFTRSGLFVWYSSGTLHARRGSVMSYVVHDGRALPWFASLVPGEPAWRAKVVKGLGVTDVADLLTHPIAVHA